MVIITLLALVGIPVTLFVGIRGRSGPHPTRTVLINCGINLLVVATAAFFVFKLGDLLWGPTLVLSSMSLIAAVRARRASRNTVDWGPLR